MMKCDMVDLNDILAWADAVRRTFEPAKIVLFGSYVIGRATEDSDVDVLVVMPYEGASHRAASRIRTAVEADFPLDIIVRSPAEMQERLAMRDYFVMDMLEQGVVLHDTDDRRVGEQGRKRLRRRWNSPAVPKARPA